MLLFEPFQEQYNKQEVQKAAKVIFFGKPSQDYLFNFISGVAANNNGVISLSFETIQTHLSAKQGKEVSISAISQLVKKLVTAGVIEYRSVKLSGNKNSVGTFRIAPLNQLLQLAKSLVDKFVVAATEVIEVAAAAVETTKAAISKVANTFKKPSSRHSKVKKGAVVPDWLENYSNSSQTITPPLTDKEAAEKRIQLEKRLAQYKQNKDKGDK